MSWKDHVTAYRAEWVNRYIHPADAKWKEQLLPAGNEMEFANQVGLAVGKMLREAERLGVHFPHALQRTQQWRALQLSRLQQHTPAAHTSSSRSPSVLTAESSVGSQQGGADSRWEDAWMDDDEEDGVEDEDE